MPSSMVTIGWEFRLGGLEADGRQGCLSSTLRGPVTPLRSLISPPASYLLSLSAAPLSSLSLFHPKRTSTVGTEEALESAEVNDRDLKEDSVNQIGCDPS